MAIMKKVLCFGDSNTHGYNPYTGLRYDKTIRWTGVLAELSKNKFEIVEAGRTNRTAFTDSPYGIEQTGYKILPKYYNNSFDILILSIGANDLQKSFNVEPYDFYEGMTKLIHLAKEINNKAEIILVAPALIKDEVINSPLGFLFDKTSVEKSKLLPEIYFEIAKKENIYFIDWSKLVETTKEDGLHFSKESHKKIAENFYEFLCKMEK